ncbi:MAG: PKD domain-containing protein [Bacteroidota bacterium]
MKKIIQITLLLLLFFNNNSRAQWSTTFAGIDSLSPVYGDIWSLYNSKDTVLYIGGSYMWANQNQVNGLIAWNGSTFHGFGDGLTTWDCAPFCIDFYQDMLYIGGCFTEVDHTSGTASIAKYDFTWNWWGTLNTGWSGVSPSIYDLKVFNNLLFVVGDFNSIQGSNYYLVAAYDGTNWIDINPGIDITGAWAKSLEIYNGELYAGGRYGAYKYLGGTSWHYYSDGPWGSVDAMKTDTFNNFLYVGGDWNMFGNGKHSCGAACWNGYYWEIMDTIVPLVYSQALEIYRGDLYAGGGYMDTLLNGQYAGNIVRWDGVKWNSLGIGINYGYSVNALEVFRDTLIVGGSFDTIGGLIAKSGIAKWYAPDTGCNYIKPRVFTLADTFKINTGQPTVNVQFYNNNAYVDSWTWDFGDMGTGNTQNPTHTYTATGTYNVSCTVTHNACIKTANKTIVVIDNTGIEDYTKESLNFKLYPNPTSGDVTVECTLPPDTERSRSKGELKTHNANGSMKDSYALQGGVNKIRIPSTGLVTGVSLVSVFIDGKFVLTEKVVKQ